MRAPPGREPACKALPHRFHENGAVVDQGVLSYFASRALAKAWKHAGVVHRELRRRWPPTTICWRSRGPSCNCKARGKRGCLEHLEDCASTLHVEAVFTEQFPRRGINPNKVYARGHSRECGGRLRILGRHTPLPNDFSQPVHRFHPVGHLGRQSGQVEIQKERASRGRPSFYARAARGLEMDRSGRKGPQPLAFRWSWRGPIYHQAKIYVWHDFAFRLTLTSLCRINSLPSWSNS